MPQVNSVIINLPYTAQAAPPAVAKRLALGPEEWQLEHWRLTDPYLADIAREAAVFEKRRHKVVRPVITYPYSPLVADPWGLLAAELAEGEAPAAGPAILPRTTAGKPLAAAWGEKDRHTIFQRTTAPFMEELERAAGETLAESPMALIVTLRSFAAMPQDFEKDRRYPRPQACVVTAGAMTPEGLANLTGDAFKAFRWWAELNRPHVAPCPTVPPGLLNSPRVRAIGLSLARGLYMDERTGRRKGAMAKSVVRVLKTVFNLFDQEMGHVARLRLERARAEEENSPIIKADKMKRLEHDSPDH